MKIFAIRDSAVEAFLQPFFAPTTGAAIRSVSEAVNDPQHQFSKHAKDYHLWLLGDFDDGSGNIVPTIPPLSIVACVELINKA